VIATVMRVKNEEPYIEKAIKSLLPLGGPIIVLDDGSTDKTQDILQEFAKDESNKIEYHRQDDRPMDEGRDRTFIYKEALKKGPDWIFTLDGDERLDPTTPERMFRAIHNCPDEVNVFEMMLAVMAGERGQHWYGAPWAWSMDRLFRVKSAYRTHKFTSNFKNNLHCGCVPKMKDYNKQKLNAWIQYFGYETNEAVQKKLNFYQQHDPVNFARVKSRALDRKTYPVHASSKNPDARECGIHGTVIY